MRLTIRGMGRRRENVLDGGKGGLDLLFRVPRVRYRASTTTQLANPLLARSLGSLHTLGGEEDKQKEGFQGSDSSRSIVGMGHPLIPLVAHAPMAQLAGDSLTVEKKGSRWDASPKQ